MALRNYNNNDKGPINATFSSIAFSNTDSKIMQSRFSISYFNKLMKVSIALRNNANSNDAYATYDTDGQISVFVSFSKAIVLSKLIDKFKTEKDINNVCIELKNGLLKISNGAEYGTDNPCISISYADEAGNINEVVYETKTNYYTGAYNYNDGKFSSETFPNIEIDAFDMALNEYYKAQSYAQAAAYMEASMYKRQSLYDLIKSIADHVGASSSNNKQYNNKTFLSNNGTMNNNSNKINDIPKEYETTSFDDIAKNM